MEEMCRDMVWTEMTIVESQPNPNWKARVQAVHDVLAGRIKAYIEHGTCSIKGQ